jgi:hypothetical protein
MGLPVPAVAVAVQERRVNAKSWAQLEKLAARCADALRNRHRQSADIWRGDMWAIVAAHHDIRKAREKARAKAAIDPHVGGTTE